MLKYLFVTAISFLVLGEVALGQTPLEKAAAEFIVGNCYYTLDDISRVKSTARILKWPVMPPEMANALKPVDADGYEAWHIQENGQHFFVGVNKGKMNGRPAEVCSVVTNHRPDVIVPLVLGSLKSKLLRRDPTGFQVWETYELRHPTLTEAILQITRSLHENAPPVSFGFVGTHSGSR